MNFKFIILPDRIFTFVIQIFQRKNSKITKNPNIKKQFDEQIYGRTNYSILIKNLNLFIVNLNVF